MRNFQKKRGFQYYLRSKPVLVFLALILIIFAWNVYGLVGKFEDTYKNKKEEEQKISDLEARKAKLTSDISKLGTDEGKEEIIRNNYGLVKEGEQEIVIVDDKSQVATPPLSESKGFLSWLKNLFK